MAKKFFFCLVILAIYMEGKSNNEERVVRKG